MLASSCSMRILPPRPYPCCLLTRSSVISWAAIGRLAGIPSRTVVSIGPWDSPAVRYRNMALFPHRSSRQTRRFDSGTLQQILDTILRKSITVLPLAGKRHIQRNRQDRSRADATLGNERHRSTSARLNLSAAGIPSSCKGGLGCLAILSDLLGAAVQIELIKEGHRGNYNISQDRVTWLENQRRTKGVRQPIIP